MGEGKQDQLDVGDAHELDVGEGEVEDKPGQGQDKAEPDRDEPDVGEADENHFPPPAEESSIAAALRAKIEADPVLASKFNLFLQSKNQRTQMSDYNWVQIYWFAIDFNSHWFQQRIEVQVCHNILVLLAKIGTLTCPGRFNSHPEKTHHGSTTPLPLMVHYSTPGC